jgi:hypothetical protein
MVLPARFSQGTPGWYDNPTMPNFEDYANDPAGYDAAVQAWVASQNGGAAGTAPTIDPVTGWRTAGSQRMADMSQGEYDANYLNARANSAAAQVNAGNPDHPNAGPYFQLAMQSRNQVRPEQMQSAYNAAQAGTGGPSPILNDAMLNLLESFGYAPPSAGSGAPGQGGGGGGSAPAPGRVDINGNPLPGAEPPDLTWHPAQPGTGPSLDDIYKKRYPEWFDDDPNNNPGTPPWLNAGPYQPSAPGSPSSGVLPGSLPGGDPLAALQTQAGGVPPPPRDRAPYMPGMGFGNGPSDIGPQNTFWDVNMSGPPSIPPGMEDILAGYLGGGGGMGGNPDTIARFMDFQKRKQMQMQPPIMPAGQGY